MDNSFLNNMTTTQRAEYATIINQIDKIGVRVFNFINHLTKHERIGTGSVMDVYDGYLIVDGNGPIRVALKEPRMKVTARTSNRVINHMLEDIHQELKIMKHFESHPYIIDLYGAAFQDLKPILVVELATSTLLEYLIERKEEKNPVDWPTKSRICCEIADGLHALHQNEIVHGDIKGEKILLFPDTKSKEKLIAKISDFGYSLSKVSNRESRGIGMTPVFCAPECTKSAPIEIKVLENKPSKDNYSYGLLVWQITQDGQEPFDGIDIDEIDKLKHSDKELKILMDQLDDGAPEEFRTIIIGMTRYNPVHRSSLEDVRDIMTNNNDNTFIEAKATFEATTTESIQDFGMSIFNSVQLMTIPKSIKSRIACSYENSVSSGDAEAAYFLSICYGSGFGVIMDKGKMISCAVKAAECGNLEAIKIIASHYVVHRDLSDYITFLFPWLLKAAEAGHRDSMLQVAKCYYSGVGVGESFTKHIEWVKKLSDISNIVVPVQPFPIQSSLHRAAREGTLDIVKFILQYEKLDVNLKDYSGSTPLHQAAEGGHINVARMVLAEFGADVGAKDNNGQTPLHIAAEYGHLEIAKLLVMEFEADVNAKGINGRTPLHLAANNGHLEIVRFFVVLFGADVNAKDIKGWTPLHLSARNGHVELMKLLLIDLGANMNVKGTNGRTPLHLATTFQDIDAARLLVVEFGADVNVRDNNGQTPLHLAAEYGIIEAVKLFVIEFGVDVNIRDSDGRTPLHSASRNGHLSIVELLVMTYGADVDARKFNGQTPLHSAAKLKTVAGTNWLAVEFGADVNAKDNNGQIPLHSAAEYGVRESIDLFVTKFGVDVNVQDFRGETPLHYAAKNGRTENVQLLVGELGADINVVDSKGQTPLVYGVGKGHTEVVMVLLKQFHADVNAKDENGQTLLHLAVKFRQEQAIEMLVEQFYLDIYAKDTKGRTPLELADEPPVHFGIVCDGCGNDPIIGDRYKCPSCRNFNFCSACFFTVEHNREHVLKIIELPIVNYLLVSYDF